MRRATGPRRPPRHPGMPTCGPSSAARILRLPGRGRRQSRPVACRVPGSGSTRPRPPLRSEAWLWMRKRVLLRSMRLDGPEEAGHRRLGAGRALRPSTARRPLIQTARLRALRQSQGYVLECATRSRLPSLPGQVIRHRDVLARGGTCCGSCSRGCHQHFGRSQRVDPHVAILPSEGRLGQRRRVHVASGPKLGMKFHHPELCAQLLCESRHELRHTALDVLNRGDRPCEEAASDAVGLFEQKRPPRRLASV